MADRDDIDSGPILAFGTFQLDRKRRLLLDGESDVRIGGRAFDLLVALLEKPGEVLGHQELVARAWPRVVVEDSSLRVNIGALRKALGDGVNGARYIASVPGRGYSFVAPVHLPDSASDITLTTPDSIPNNLPLRLNRVIGRDKAVASVSESLTRHRLATMVGHGGIGKTTLALAVATQLAHEFSGGVCFVDLAPFSDPAHTASVLGVALGLVVDDIDAIPVINSYLADRRMLLIIDNCEHVIESAAYLIDAIVRNAPWVHVLATSREPLDIEGEWIYRLTPLDIPPEIDSIDCESALTFSALELLVERVTASVDTFVLDKGNMDAAITLCRKLDGVPLAIEFAAARIGLLGLDGMVGQLQDRLRLLGTGRRTVLPRHRTLRALIDWSYELLSSDEKLVLRRISMFRDNFTLDSATSVLADASISAATVRNCVLSLVTKSLLRVEFQMAIPYFQLLEITRAYALEKLDDESEGADLNRRHAQEIFKRIQNSEREWELMDRIKWLSTCLRFVRDLRAALDWAFGPDGDPALGIEMSTSMLVHLPYFLGVDEQKRRAKQATDAIRAGAPFTALQALRIDSVFRNYDFISAPTEIKPLGNAAEAMATARELDQPAEQVEVLYREFVRGYRDGFFDEIDCHANNALLIAQACGDDVMITHAERMYAQTQHYCGKHANALRLTERVLLKADEKIPLRFASVIERRLSMRIVQSRIAWLTGQTNRAADIAEELIAMVSPDDHPIALCQVLGWGICPIAMWRGDLNLATTMVDRLIVHSTANEKHDWKVWGEYYKDALSLWRDPRSWSHSNLSDQVVGNVLDHVTTFDPRLLTPLVSVRLKEARALWCAPEVMRAEAEGWLARPEPEFEKSATALRAAIELAQNQGALAWKLRAAISLANLHIRQARKPDAIALLEPIIEEFALDDSGIDYRTAVTLIG